MNSNRRCIQLVGAGVLLFLTTLLPGGASAAPARKPARKPAVKKKPAPKPAAKAPGKAPQQLDDHPLIARLTQVESGPGVVVCEPVPAAGTSTELAAFGNGCGRWLHLVVGGQSELGRTPLWTAVDQARKELKRSDLRLGLAEAVRLPAITGVTHAALGTLKGDTQSAELSYQLYELASKKPLGAAVTAKGTPAEITTRLNELAKELATSLGVKAPRVPYAVDDTAEGLQLLGTVAWRPKALTAAQMTELDRQVELLHGLQVEGRKPGRPVAGPFAQLLFGAFVKNTTTVNHVASGLLKALPQNTLVLAEAARWGYRTKSEVQPAIRTNVDGLLSSFPKNYLLLTASAYNHRQLGKVDSARVAAEDAVRSSVRNPEAWLVLGGTIHSQADSIRHARTVDQLTPAQMARCEEYYAERVPVVMKAVMLDEACAMSWRDLSAAAAFLSIADLADGAFGKALALDPTDTETLWWGLELYQPKWFGDEEKLRSVAAAVVSAAPKLWSTERVELAIALVHAKRIDEANEITKNPLERSQVLRHFDKHVPH